MTREKKTSKYVGVSKKLWSWTATIQKDGQRVYLGSFKTENEAALAIQKANLEKNNSGGK